MIAFNNNTSTFPNVYCKKRVIKDRSAKRQNNQHSVTTAFRLCGGASPYNKVHRPQQRLVLLKLMLLLPLKLRWFQPTTAFLIHCKSTKWAKFRYVLWPLPLLLKFCVTTNRSSSLCSSKGQLQSTSINNLMDEGQQKQQRPRQNSIWRLWCMAVEHKINRVLRDLLHQSE